MNISDTRALCRGRDGPDRRQTEAKTETRRRAGRQKDIMKEREPETENLAETAKEM